MQSSLRVIIEQRNRADGLPLWLAPLVVLLCCVLSPPCVAESPTAKPHGKDHSSSIHSHPDAKPIVLPKSYLQAVENARTATAKNISRDLTAIIRSNNSLVWKQQSNSWQVLVATWTSEASYYPKPGTTFQEDYSVWVTAAPHLKKFCEAYQPGNRGLPLPRRLEQLLGLPPNSGHKYVVELWVDPNALFRPSADPATTDYEAQLVFPEVRGYVGVSDDYKQWYQTTSQQRYQPQTGPPYPWTRLGYTYDWGNPTTRVGLSEFVILEGTNLTVHSVSTTEDYAKQRTP